MAKTAESVLYYNPGTPESMKHVAKMKSVLVRMGVRIRNIRPEQTGQTVGFLAGIEGFGERETEEEFFEIPEEMLVMKHFSSRRLDELLQNFRKAGVPRIAIKAVVTEQNAGWPFYKLYQELRREHEAMHGISPAGKEGAQENTEETTGEKTEDKTGEITA